VGGSDFGDLSRDFRLLKGRANPSGNRAQLRRTCSLDMLGDAAQRVRGGNASSESSGIVSLEWGKVGKVNT
jgi:hypothetical protein